MPSPSQRLGGIIEARASQHLQQAGLTLLLTNFHSRFGELDLVMREGAALVVVEVRHRKAHAPVSAAASIGSAKQQRVVRATEVLRRRFPTLASLPIRFDVVTIDGDPQSAEVQWQRDAFRPW